MCIRQSPACADSRTEVEAAFLGREELPPHEESMSRAFAAQVCFKRWLCAIIEAARAIINDTRGAAPATMQAAANMDAAASHC